MQQRIVRRFLVFPLILMGIRRWLCLARIRQEMVTWHDEGFVDWCWLDKEFV
jgi:hypothetical protein